MNKITINVALLAALACGCESANKPKNVGLDTTAIPTDEAMQHRNWDESHAVYARSGIITQATLFSYQSKELPYGRGYSTSLTETPLFVGNVLMMPSALWQTHSTRYGPFGAFEARGDVLEPSYSAMPPLPPDPSAAPPAPPAQSEPQATPPAEPTQENPTPPAPTNEPAPAPAPAPAPQTDQPAGEPSK